MRDFVQPRTWLFGENRATPADEDFLAELLEDAVASALDATRAALHGAVADAAADPETGTLAAQASRTVDAALELFAAYARGTIRAGVVPDFFRHQLPRLRLELPAIREALARRAPSPEAPLFAGLRRELEPLFRQAATEREARAADEAMRAIIHDEAVERPLAALGRSDRRAGSGLKLASAALALRAEERRAARVDPPPDDAPHVAHGSPSRPYTSSALRVVPRCPSAST